MFNNCWINEEYSLLFIQISKLQFTKQAIIKYLILFGAKAPQHKMILYLHIDIK